MKPANPRTASTLTTSSSNSASTSSVSSHPDPPLPTRDAPGHPPLAAPSPHAVRELHPPALSVPLQPFVRPHPGPLLIIDPALTIHCASDRALDLLGPVASLPLASVCRTVQSADDLAANSLHLARLFDQARREFLRLTSGPSPPLPGSGLPPGRPPPEREPQRLTSVLVRHPSLSNILLPSDDPTPPTIVATTSTSLLSIYAFEPCSSAAHPAAGPQLWFNCQLSPPTTDPGPSGHSQSHTGKFIDRMKHVIFDSIVDWPMHAISVDRTISMANPAACKLFQDLHLIEEFPDQGNHHHHPYGLHLSSSHKTGDCFNFGPWKLFDPDFKVEVPVQDFPMERAIRGETTTRQQYGCILPDGTRRVITLSAKTIRDSPLKFYPDGSTDDIIGGLLYVNDVTDEFERTRQVEREKELLKAEALAADDANKSKSTFLSNMSHEIRMPIAVIHGLIDLLLDSHLTPQQRDYAETIKASADCLLSVIGDVLDLSKIESGKLTFERAPFDLTQLVSETERLFSYPAKSKSNEFKCLLDIDPRLAGQTKVVGDRGRIRQVLNNLISNALKFTTHGSVKCYTRLEPYLSNVLDKDPNRDQEPHHPKLKLTAEVVDTGIGLTTQSLHRLSQFEPFSQADSSTSKLYGGSGLGLCIVKSFVDAMGGQVSLESEGLGKGCKATVIMIVDKLDEYPSQSPLKFNLNNSGNSYFPNGLTQHNNNFQNTQSVSRSCFPSAPLESQSSDRDQQQSTPAPSILPAKAMMMPTKRKIDRSKYSILIAEDNPIIGQITLSILKKSGFVLLDLVNNGQAALDRIYKKFNVYQPDSSSSSFSSSSSSSSSFSSSSSPSLSIEDRENDEEKVTMLDHRKPPKLGRNHPNQAAHQQDKPYDLVLMDLMMPVLDGFETLKAIRKAIPDVYLPVIALSASASRIDRERCQEAKFDDFVTKPVKFDELERRLMHFLSRVDEIRGHNPNGSAEAEPSGMSLVQERRPSETDYSNSSVLDSRSTSNSEFGSLCSSSNEHLVDSMAYPSTQFSDQQDQSPATVMIPQPGPTCLATTSLTPTPTTIGLPPTLSTKMTTPNGVLVDEPQAGVLRST